MAKSHKQGFNDRDTDQSSNQTLSCAEHTASMINSSNEENRDMTEQLESRPDMYEIPFNYHPRLCVGRMLRD